MLDPIDVVKILEDCDALITNSHVVYTSGRHGSDYVEKKNLYKEHWQTIRVCRAIGSYFKLDLVDVVVGPESGGTIIAGQVANYLQEAVMAARHVTCIRALKRSDGTFVIEPGLEQYLSEKNVLVVDDILTTGGTVRKIVELIRSLGGKVIGVGGLCNRGGITKEDVGDVYKLATPLALPLEDWAEEECPLCKANIPINTDIGKGKEFLERKERKTPL